jgi:outer membrane protein
MVVRHGLLLGLGVLLTAASAVAQTATPTTPQAATKLTATPLAAAPTQAPPLAAIPPSRAGKPPATRLPSPNTVPHTLAESLAATYLTQPALLAERAKLRATDENVPQALAGWRPTIVMAGSLGYGDGMNRAYTGTLGTYINTRTDRAIASAQATVTQNIYTGGKTQAQINHANNQVMSERANLIVQEEQSFIDTVNAYVGVIQDQQLLALDINNEQVLAEQLRATNDRFRVGEITRTDVAQAEAALAGASAQREIAEGNLQTARSTFQRVVGFIPPPDLVEPQPLKLPVKTEQEAAALASSNNASVIFALFNDAAAKDQVDIAFSALLPQVNVTGQIFQDNNTGARSASTNGYQVLANLSVPLYQGGAEYSTVRQAKQTQQQTSRQIDDAKRTAVQSAVQAWETLIAARAAADSTRAQIRANQVALEGVEREAIVGSRTTLDVLNAQQALLTSEVNLIQALTQLITASYTVAQSVGRLTARDLSLPVPLYDDTAYFNAVKNKWFGLGDYATNQPGR